MSTRKFTAEELIAYIRRRASIPNKSSAGSQDSDLINILNEELFSIMVPWVRRMREEYFVVTQRVPIVSGQTRYRIPSRAVGQQIRQLYHWNGTSRRKFRIVAREQLDEFNTTSSFGDQDPAFYLEGNHIVLVPDSSTALTGSLEVSFHMRPGELVLSSEARRVASVDAANKIITLDSNAPTSWTVSEKYDIHSSLSGAEVRQYDIMANDITANQMTFNEAIDGSVWGTYTPEAGDYVVLAGEAAIPGLPIELHIPLAQSAVCRVVEQLGDVELLREHKQTLVEMLSVTTQIIQNRAESHPKKVVSRNPLWGFGYSNRLGQWG